MKRALMMKKAKRLFRAALFAVPLVLFGQNCSLQQPRAVDLGSSATGFDHSKVAGVSCLSCHEPDRPAARAGVAHGGGADCLNCHVAGTSWTSAVGFNHSGITSNCASCHDTGQAHATLPSGHRATGGRDCSVCHTPTAWNRAMFSHSPTPTSCATCHQANLPATGHVATNGQDCASCHNTTVWKGANPHSPTPTSCAQCHGSGQTVARLPTTHRAVGGRDCISCHTTSGWTNAFFSHSPKPTSCATCHQANFPATGHIATSGQDCVSCHATDVWTNATFNHSPTPTSCNACHIGARPATGLRMNRDPGLANTSHYAVKDCAQCHRPPPTTTSFTFTHKTAAGANINFCLPCHYDVGRSKHRSSHPEYFQAPLYDYANGALGNCYSCHNKGKSWGQ